MRLQRHFSSLLRQLNLSTDIGTPLHIARSVSAAISPSAFATSRRHQSTTTTAGPSSSTVDPAEIARFNRLASQWWNPDGPYALLRRMNPLRVSWMRSVVDRFEARKVGGGGGAGLATGKLPLERMKILDVGCGGGFLTESLVRLGGNVTGIDASVENVKVAEAHAAADPSLTEGPGSLKYLNVAAEDLTSTEQGTYDIVCAMEILEHVSSVPDFISSCRSLLKPGGYLFLSTINRTPFSWFLTVFVAEDVLGLVPKGTHEHGKYVTPQELERALEAFGDLHTVDVKGVGYDPLGRNWFTMGASEVEMMANYFVAVRKA